mmetsp:Transcript_22813/g.63512  ORF Transcript_22813/g.63512 Transcript_22813/m.63512 type:complete len:220 (-) Transcript_22813:981-1640(-)
MDVMNHCPLTAQQRIMPNLVDWADNFFLFLLCATPPVLPLLVQLLFLFISSVLILAAKHAHHWPRFKQHGIPTSQAATDSQILPLAISTQAGKQGLHNRAASYEQNHARLGQDALLDWWHGQLADCSSDRLSDAMDPGPDRSADWLEVERPANLRQRAPTFCIRLTILIPFLVRSTCIIRAFRTLYTLHNQLQPLRGLDTARHTARAHELRSKLRVQAE